MAHPEKPPVLQSFDSKWWGWQDSLKKNGVSVHFLCPDEIKAKYESSTRTTKSRGGPVGHSGTPSIGSLNRQEAYGCCRIRTLGAID